MIRNTSDSWGWPAVVMHWVVAVLILGTFGLGLAMDEVPRAEQPFYITVHASLGATLLFLLVVRIAWALANPAPAAPAGTPPLQQKAARFTHLALYILTLTTVLFGWLLASLQDPPVVPLAFGIVPLPSPWTLSRASEDFVEEAHEIAAYLLIAVACLHVAAALWHHFVLKDGTLRRMSRLRSLNGQPVSSGPSAR